MRSVGDGPSNAVTFWDVSIRRRGRKPANTKILAELVYIKRNKMSEKFIDS